MSPTLLTCLVAVGTTLFFGLPVLMLCYAVMLWRERRRQALPRPVLWASGLTLGLMAAGLLLFLAANAVPPPNNYAWGWAGVTILGLGALAALSLLPLRPRPRLRARLGAVLAVVAVFVTGMGAFSLRLAARASEIMRYSDFNEASVQAALAHAPNDPAPHYNMGNIDIMRGDYASAVQELQQAARLEPPGSAFKSETLFLLGAALFRIHQTAQAMAVERQLATYHDGFGRKARGYLAKHP